MPGEDPLSAPTDLRTRELREASRRLVRGLGMIQSRPSGLDCTAAQCHALIELEAHGQLTGGELAQLLEVDKSTASRALRPLLRRGWTEDVPGVEGLRTRPLRLTAAGRRRVQRIHSAADAQVRRALELVSEEERAAILRGVSLYERALHRAKALDGVVVRPILARDNAAMASLIRSVMTEFDAVGGGTSIGDPEVDGLSRAYRPKGHAYFVAERDGVLLGGAGIAPLRGAEGTHVCELRKMHALPVARGLGVGRRLLERCLAAARGAGYRVCYLETLRHMLRARALYEKVGFVALEQPMGDTGHYACDGWYVLEL